MQQRHMDTLEHHISCSGPRKMQDSLHSPGGKHRVRRAHCLLSIQFVYFRSMAAAGTKGGQGVVYNRNHYFGLGPKPKLADTFSQYRNRFQRENLVTNSMGHSFFSIITGPLKPNLVPNIQVLDYF
jgi:hypothetical protein